MQFYRTISAAIEQIARQSPCLVVVGARQTGKSTLIRSLFPEHSYVSLDLPEDAALAEQQPATFLERYAAPVIIDEVQYAPGLFRHIKQRIDNARASYGQFILSGSQKFSLMESVSDSLAGRTRVVELEALSFTEIAAKTPKLSIENFVFRGGMPELHAAPEMDATAFHRSYAATYLERDVRNLLRVTQLRDFDRLLRAVALRSSGILNKADLARDVGISPSTANQWLTVLEASNQITLLEPWFSNGTKSMVKSPKIYFNDSGMMCFLLGLTDVGQLLQSPLAGAIYETAVFSEMRKRQSFARNGKQLWYYRDRSVEVDFLTHEGGTFDLYECKLTEVPNTSDFASMRKAELTLKNVRSKTLLSRVAHEMPVADGWAKGFRDSWF